MYQLLNPTSLAYPAREKQLTEIEENFEYITNESQSPEIFWKVWKITGKHLTFAEVTF